MPRNKILHLVVTYGETEYHINDLGETKSPRFELEANMHKYFEAYRVHPDREFFYASPKEAIDVLKNKFNCEVHFEDVEEDSDE